MEKKKQSIPNPVISAQRNISVKDGSNSFGFKNNQENLVYVSISILENTLGQEIAEQRGLSISVNT
ncbi:MAG: hypothetical protein R2783_08040 [Gelidibacter sp.]